MNLNSQYMYENLKLNKKLRLKKKELGTFQIIPYILGVCIDL